MGQVHQLELDVRDDPGVLLRVVGICHKRGIAIASLHYGPAACGGQILLGVRSDVAGAERLGLWLAAIVRCWTSGCAAASAAGCRPPRSPAWPCPRPPRACDRVRRLEPAAFGHACAVARAQVAQERLGEAGHMRVAGQDTGREVQALVRAEVQRVDQVRELDAQIPVDV